MHLAVVVEEVEGGGGDDLVVRSLFVVDDHVERATSLLGDLADLEFVAEIYPLHPFRIHAEGAEIRLLGRDSETSVVDSDLNAYQVGDNVEFHELLGNLDEFLGVLESVREED